MAYLVDLQDIATWQSRIEQLEADNQFLKALLLNQKWLTRTQASSALSVSLMTLHRLTKAKQLTVRYEGTKPLYSVEGVRNYMNTRKIDAKAIDNRLIAAIHAQ